jgi:hypothetical protein
MKRSIFDQLEYILAIFFVAASGLTLFALLHQSYSSTFSQVVVLVATILLIIVLVIQFIRRFHSQ